MRLVPGVALFVVVLASSGCLSADSDQPGPEQDVADAPASTLPAPFSEQHAFLGMEIQVGGITLSHSFTITQAATLHATVSWVLPEPTVTLQVRSGDEVVFLEAIPAPGLESVQRDIQLPSGDYTVMASLMGVGTLKEFTLSGSFS